MKLYGLLFLFGICFPTILFSQQTTVEKKVLIALINKEDFQNASIELNKHLQFYKNRKLKDSLSTYPYYLGKITLHLSNASSAIKTTENFIEELKKSGASARNLFTASMEYVLLLDELGKTQKSYNITLEALAYAQQMPDKTGEETGYVIYNLGAGALSLGDISLAKKHFKETLQHYKSYTPTSAKKLADAYNAMGAVMWLSTKLDSARVYYNLSVEAIKQSNTDSITKKMLSAITLANIALIEQSQGKTTAAMATLQETLQHYQMVIQYSEDPSQREKAKRYQGTALSNLAVFNNDLGDFSMANSLLTHLLESQKKELQPDDPELSKTQVTVAQSLMSLQKYKEAQQLFLKALVNLNAAPGAETYWKAITVFGLAETAEALQDIPAAKEYYTQSEVLFEKTFQGEYDRQYLDFLTKKTMFLAEQGANNEAEKLALKGYHYTLKTAKNDFFIQFKQKLNMAGMYYKIGDFLSARSHSEEALELLKKIETNGNTIDAVQVEYQKPQALLYKAMATYYLQKNKDTLFLKELYHTLQEALELVERQKSISSTLENNAIVTENNKELFQFIKKLGLELFKKTGDTQYLKNVIGFHESGLYHKIRNRFNKRNSIAFTGVPQDVIEKEALLKHTIKEALHAEDENVAGMEPFFNATTAWSDFLKEIKTNYPEYYAMRYETISENTELIQQKLDPTTSVVRYFFNEKQLYALVITTSQMELFSLDFSSVASKVAHGRTNHQLSQEYDLLHELYLSLWKPLAKAVTTKNVIIIPDDVLFNISFESLLRAPSDNKKDFIKYSLLKKHVISYNYSLRMLHQSPNTSLSKNYVAFAPGFMDEMKSSYKNKASTILMPDVTYLSLLSQPFTIDLIKKLKKKYRGNIYLYEASTRSNFIKNASGAKIIHIGTHAESNNLSPEFSRLLFAKDPAQKTAVEENSLYAHQIYTHDFTTHLAVLTACETGKPEYQSGEGMISLAHAFNYAGSESIITSLWQIDEQASAIVLESFYEFLADGYSKAEAFQKAKLEYLEQAEGRTASPQYWAGLILIGDPSPILLESTGTYFYWLLPLACILIGIGVFYYFKKR